MLSDAIASALRQDSWHVDVAYDARSAQVALIDHTYAALLLDLALVRRIAQSHHATITTGVGLDGLGFGIAVSFPALLTLY